MLLLLKKHQKRSSPAAPVATTSAVVEVNVPDIGGDEVNVTEIMVKVAIKLKWINLSSTLKVIKPSMEVPAPVAGVVKKS